MSMAAGGGDGDVDVDVDGDEEPMTICGSAPGSPRSRVKFLCSHGGKILPRQSDGHLKYVGGETRIISVHRDITFPQLMKKLTYLIDGNMILKYQLIPEELDALVSVKSNEDLRHMFEEYDRHERSGYPRLRAFLFPENPIIIANQMVSMDRHSLEQRYINSINGILHPIIPLSLKPATPISRSRPSFSISPTCTSPRSPTPRERESTNTTDGMTHETMLLHKVHSSPSLSNLNGQPQNNRQIHQQPHYHYYQSYRQPQPPHFHHQQVHYKPLLDPNKSGGGPEFLLRVRSTGLTDYSRYPSDHAPHYHYAQTRTSRASVCCNKCLHYDDYGTYGNGGTERAESLPVSPAIQSPHHGSFTSKAWDSDIA